MAAGNRHSQKGLLFVAKELPVLKLVSRNPQTEGLIFVMMETAKVYY
jgi:hypothetical protein